MPGKAFAAANEQLYGFHDTGPSAAVKHGCHALAINENRHNFVPTLWTGQEWPGTTIEQVWFAGAHADVGGGYKTRTLADIPLVWMAKKAEANGLSLDWTCLPDLNTLDAKAPTHDSCSGVFLLDRFHRTWRQVAETGCDVAFNEHIYTPIDMQGNRLRTINEAIHESAIARVPQATICTDDDAGTEAATSYNPSNLQPFFDEHGRYTGPPLAKS